MAIDRGLERIDNLLPKVPFTGAAAVVGAVVKYFVSYRVTR